MMIATVILSTTAFAFSNADSAIAPGILGSLETSEDLRTGAHIAVEAHMSIADIKSQTEGLSQEKQLEFGYDLLVDVLGNLHQEDFLEIVHGVLEAQHYGRTDGELEDDGTRRRASDAIADTMTTIKAILPEERRRGGCWGRGEYCYEWSCWRCCSQRIDKTWYWIGIGICL